MIEYINQNLRKHQKNGIPVNGTCLSELKIFSLENLLRILFKASQSYIHKMLNQQLSSQIQRNL